MCYTGRCPFEGYMGECSLYEEDKKLIEERFGIRYPCPDSKEAEEICNEIYKWWLERKA
jgi:hypothetical protein